MTLSHQQRLHQQAAKTVLIGIQILVKCNSNAWLTFDIPLVICLQSMVDSSYFQFWGQLGKDYQLCWAPLRRRWLGPTSQTLVSQGYFSFASAKPAWMKWMRFALKSKKSHAMPTPSPLIWKGLPPTSLQILLKYPDVNRINFQEKNLAVS